MSLQLSLIGVAAVVALAISGCGGTQGAGDAGAAAASASSVAGGAGVPVDAAARTTSAAAGTIGDTATAAVAVSEDDVPRVEDVVLVSSTRVDRTRFDYKFKLLVKGAYESYEAGSFSVAKLPKGSQATVATVSLGQIDALRLVPSAETITLRHDRTYPFIKSDLKFTFSGKLAGTSAPPDAPKIGPLKFYAAGGRPGHEGFFEIPSSTPRPGIGTQLRVAVPGTVSAVTYTFKSASGATLSTGPINKLWAGSDDASAMVDIPSEPFTVTIAAIGSNGASASLTSGLMQPETRLLDLVIENGAFKFGQVIRGRLDIGESSKADQLVVEMSLPDKFTAAQTRFEIPVGLAVNTVVPLLIQTPVTGEAINFYNISILYYLKSAPTAINTSVISVFSR